MANDETPSDVVAARVRQVRAKRGMTVAALAARCAELGVPQLSAQALYKLEGQRESATRRPRPVSVDELLALAAALNCPPLCLLVSPDGAGPYAVTPEVSERPFHVRAWIRGLGELLEDDDPREYFAELPRGEYYLPSYAGDDEHEGHFGVQQGPPMRRTEPTDGQHR